jgi:DNA-directed RNA polymerase specialized sigma24 family protein
VYHRHCERADKAASARPALTKIWIQTPGAFHHLLTWLDEGVDSDGERYLEMRRRLASYFGRKRCLSPDDLADETLNRVARKLEEQGAITGASPARYCYIVAKFVFLEYLRGTEHRQASLDEVRGVPDALASPAVARADEAGVDVGEKRADCLDRCLRQLTAYDRALILEYYSGGEGLRIEDRRHLAARLGLTANALTIRACRIRGALEACVNACTAAT